MAASFSYLDSTKVFVATTLLLATSTYAQDTWTPSPLCPYPSETKVRFAYEGDCSKYWECFEGARYPMDCPEGFEFNAEEKRCDDPKVANCNPDVTITYPTFSHSIETTVPPATTQDPGPAPDCPFPSDELTFFPVSNNCSQYWECFQGNRYLMTCPGDLLWNVKASYCDFAADVDCTLNTVTTPTPTTPTPTTPTSTTPTPTTPTSTTPTPTTPTPTSPTSTTPTSTTPTPTSTTPTPTPTTPTSTTPTPTTPTPTSPTPTTPTPTSPTPTTPTPTTPTPTPTTPTPTTPTPTIPTSTTPTPTTPTPTTPTPTTPTPTTPTPTTPTPTTPTSTTPTTPTTPTPTTPTSTTPTTITPTTVPGDDTTTSSTVTTTTEGTTTEWAPDPDCPYPSDQLVFIPNPANCSQYFECFEGNKFTMSCPEDLYWNDIAKSCANKEKVNCNQTSTSSGPTTLTTVPTTVNTICEGEPDGTYLANPEDCSRFYECVRGMPSEGRCPGELVWNEPIHSCDYAVNVVCENAILLIKSR